VSDFPAIEYRNLLADIKGRIHLAQVRAAQAVHAELVRLYWEIGGSIILRQDAEGWGAGVIPRLAADLKNELPEEKGFSERNLKRMVQFHRAYPALFTDDPANGPQPVAQIPWGHIALLLQKIKDSELAQWYALQIREQGWSREVLEVKIRDQSHLRQGTAITNFQERLPQPQRELARSLLKDPYLFDFLTIEEPFHERELETGLVRHLEKFLLELGQGFAFVGRQVELSVGEQDFYVDLLFYHLKLRAYVVIELKRGAFRPEFAGKMNFYCSVVDDTMRHPTDQPTIGLILCQTKNKLVAEYALRDVHKPIGIADYELTRALPESLASSLPSIETLENELSIELEQEEE
jgi:predicted nuclease of restriction endonuclease-like (RecB) superfamily